MLPPELPAEPELPEEPELPFPELEPPEALYLLVLSFELVLELEFMELLLFELDRSVLLELADLESSRASEFKEFEFLAVVLFEFETAFLSWSSMAKAPAAEPDTPPSAAWVVPGRRPKPKSPRLLNGFVESVEPVVFVRVAAVF